MIAVDQKNVEADVSQKLIVRVFFISLQNRLL